MELSRVLLVMGLIGMQIAVSKQELLPAPNLTLLTQGVIYRGQTAKMKCTAPNNFQQSTFYLQIRDDATLIETQQAPMSNHFVIFTLSEFTAPGNYACRYRNRVDSVLEISQTSNILYLDVLDDPAPTTTNPSPAKITEVPYWIIVLVGVISAIIILGISVTLAVCIRRLYERKKKLKQREKESVWTPRDMAKDWSYDNIVYNVEQRPPLDPEHSHVIHLPNRQVLGETWTEKNFITFHSSES